MKAVAILTAREASSRLPGKIFRKVAGQTALDICLRRLSKIGIPVVLAVPGEEKVSFKPYARLHKAKLFLGSPDSPLHRIAEYLRKDKTITHVVRVTADDILIDWRTVKDMLCFAECHPDVGYISSPGIMEGAGVEVISRKNLMFAASEHGPTEFISYFVRGEGMPNPKKHEVKPRMSICRPYRLTMDYLEDWQLINTVLTAVGPDATCDNICRFLDHHPELLNINRLPALTIYTCAHNAQDTIGKTIASVLASAGRELEYIIVDDASTDGTVAEVAKFISDPRIRLIINEKNLGLASSSNVALTAARGKYIMRVDADDMLMPDNFREAFPVMRDALSAGAMCVYPSYFKGGDFMGHQMVHGEDHHHAGCALMLRSALNEFRFKEGLRHWDGLELYKRMASRKELLAYYQKPTWIYRIRRGSMSNSDTDTRASILLTLGLEGLHHA